MFDNVKVSYEIIYKDNERNREYITTDSMEFITASQKLKEYSKKYKNCRLLETKTISKEVYLNIDEL